MPPKPVTPERQLENARKTLFLAEVALHQQKKQAAAMEAIIHKVLASLGQGGPGDPDYPPKNDPPTEEN